MAQPQEGFLYQYARCLNAVPGSGALTFTCNGKPMVTGLPYFNFSRYQRAGDAPYQFALYHAGSDQPIAKLTVEIPTGGVVTVAAIGTPDDIRLLSIPEPTARNLLDVANLRICNLSPGSPGLDIYANGFPILQDIVFPEVSRYIYLRPNIYAFRIHAANSDDTLLTVPNQALEGHQYCTLYFVGRTDGDPALSAILSVDAATYVGQYL